MASDDYRSSVIQGGELSRPIPKDELVELSLHHEDHALSYSH